MSESDMEFLDGMEAWVTGSLVFKKEHRDRLFALARRGAAVDPWKIAAANHQLRVRLLAFITRYDRDNPMRTADFHDPDCGCMRCERDRAATLLSKSPLPPPPSGEPE